MKKLLSIILSAAILLSITAGLDFSAYALVSGDYEYTVLADNTAQINKYNGGAAELEIPSEIDGYRVTSIGNRAFDSCESLTSITIPDGVTNIGEGAFSSCWYLASVTVPDGLTSIGDWAFSGCCFTSIIIPDTVTSIGNNAFQSCDRLTSITIPTGVTRIGNGTFLFCNSLTSITIPDTVTTIGRMAFGGCDSLTSITIPVSVTSIGNSAFSDCSSLTDVYYNGNKAQWDNISIDENNSELTTAYMHFIDKFEYSVLADGTIEISKYIGDSTKLEIPSEIDGYTVTSIGDYAFEDCSSLRIITIPDGVTNIGEGAFLGCSSLTSIPIPESVTSIGIGAFYGCSSLTSITIPDGVTSIGNSTFEECSSLTSIIIPDGVTNIGEYAFCACSSLTSITIPDSVTNIGNIAFYGCSSLTSIIIPDGVTSIGLGVFCDCSSLTSITIPESVTSIGDEAFRGCSSLRDITIPKGVTSIGEYAFRACSNLTSITIPESVTSIGWGAFQYCSYLNKIVIRSNNCSIEDSEYTFPEPAVIYGYSGSTAQAYAEKYGRKFVAFPRVDALGGSIRINDAGLRFGFSYDETQNADVEEYGFIYSYSNKDNIEIGDEGVKKVTAQKTLTQDNVTKFNLVFTNIPVSAYEQEISARAYVKIDGIYFYSDVLHRSFSSVANAVLNDESISQDIKDKLNDILKGGA